LGLGLTHKTFLGPWRVIVLKLISLLQQNNHQSNCRSVLSARNCDMQAYCVLFYICMETGVLEDT